MNRHSDYTVRTIEPHETIGVRSIVLRPNRPIEQCHFEGDQDATSFHIGAVNCDGDVIGVATVMCNDERRYDQFSSLSQLRLRGMAVVPAFQRKGIGKALLNACLEEAARRGCQMFWCNARIVAVKFYLKCGFSILNDAPFNIDGIGPHHVMFKDMSQN